MKKDYSNCDWELYHPAPEPKQTPKPEPESEFLLGAAQYAYAVGA